MSLKPSTFDFYFSVLWGQLPSTDGSVVLWKAASVMVPASIISSHFMLNHIRFCLWPALATL